MNTIFGVVGPFKISRSGRIVTPENVKNFWKKHEKISNEKGCYVFAIKTKRITPWYVGKAAKRCFKFEALGDRNISNFINPALNGRKGIPVMFFLTYPPKKGKTNHNHIKKLEKFLTNQAFLINPNLGNTHYARNEKWGIQGILRNKYGKKSTAVKGLISCLSLEDGN